MIRRILDLPPLWLVAFVALVWGMDRTLPVSLFGRLGDWLAAGLGLSGAGLFLGGVRALWRGKTPVMPHQLPLSLVTSGVFGLTRNPIYLADTWFLLAAVLWWDVPLALPLVPLFMVVIRERFIRDEESRLRQTFGEAFETWAARVRRWV